MTYARDPLDTDYGPEDDGPDYDDDGTTKYPTEDARAAGWAAANHVRITTDLPTRFHPTEDQ